MKIMNQSHNVFSNIVPAEYAEVSVLARLAAENMVSRLELVTLQPKIILDMGCGAGESAVLLQKHYPNARIFAVDSVEAMLQYQQSLHQGFLLCADGERLPLKKHSVDLIFANLLLPWCHHWKTHFSEWHRILRPEGLLIFTCFGPDTLRELQNDDEKIVQVKDMHEIGDLLLHTRFSDPVMDVEYLTLTYCDYEKMVYELKTTGMINAEATPLLKEDDLRLTFEIVYGHTWGSAEERSDEPGIVRIPLSQLRGRSRLGE